MTAGHGSQCSRDPQTICACPIYIPARLPTATDDNSRHRCPRPDSPLVSLGGDIALIKPAAPSPCSCSSATPAQSPAGTTSSSTLQHWTCAIQRCAPAFLCGSPDQLTERQSTFHTHAVPYNHTSGTLLNPCSFANAVCGSKCLARSRSTLHFAHSTGQPHMASARA